MIGGDGGGEHVVQVKKPSKHTDEIHEKFENFLTFHSHLFVIMRKSRAFIYYRSLQTLNCSVRGEIDYLQNGQLQNKNVILGVF